MKIPRLAACGTCAVLVACSSEGQDDDGAATSRCGPTRATVERVVDGDTIVLTTGERVRYLLVDTPESTTEIECWGEESKQANSDLVAGREVTLVYDVECKDRFDRLLAYVSVDGREVNRLLLERGHACVLHIPPNGEDRVDDFRAVEDAARSTGKGLWGVCTQSVC